MSKEIEALKALNEIKDKFFLTEGDNFIGNFGLYRRLDIIETALKEREKQHQTDIDLLGTVYKTNVQNEKKIKAFEIIKEKQVDISTLLEAFNPSKMTLKAILKACESFNGLDFYNANYYQYDNESRQLTQEEFDLLKEVLL